MHAMTSLLEKTTRKTKSAILVETLVKLGVDSIFGYPGASVLSVYNELSKVNEIKHYLVRHEQAAVHAAEGYARAIGKTGVVIVTSGPGFTNTVTGIANAYADSTPLVLLVGDVAQSNSENKIFQKVDIASITKTCCKKTFTINSNDNIEQVLREAFRTAESDVKGPVVVILPRNVMESKDYSQEIYSNETPAIINKNFSADIKQLENLHKNAKRPLVLIGGGCIDAAEELHNFISKYNIPVVSTLMGIGIFPSENNLYMGMIGINGVKTANKALNECDLLIALGTSFSDRSTCKKGKFTSSCKVVSVNIQSPSIECELNINANVRDFIEKYIDTTEVSALKEQWWSGTENYKNNYRNNSDCLQSSYVLETISEYTKYYEPLIVTDVGQHQMLTAQFFHFNKPRKFITSGGLGTMGFGLPAAIGAHIANPDNLVLNITGDGSFQMNLQELATCREHHIPIKIIIMNNSSLGMVRQIQEKFYNSRFQVEMINPDFTKIAEAYDLFAIRVKTKEELVPALEKAIRHQGTAIIDIIVDSFENI